MPDMLVHLWRLPPVSVKATQLRVVENVVVKRALPFERVPTLRWVEACFGVGWADEANLGFMVQPPTVHVAIWDGAVIGFSCHDTTCRGFVGPMGVASEWRGKGIGEVLLRSTLDAMKTIGYGYAIIGGVGPAEFYAKTVEAFTIPESDPGVYADRATRMLAQESSFE